MRGLLVVFADVLWVVSGGFGGFVYVYWFRSSCSLVYCGLRWTWVTVVLWWGLICFYCDVILA